MKGVRPVKTKRNVKTELFKRYSVFFIYIFSNAYLFMSRLGTPEHYRKQDLDNTVSEVKKTKL